MSAPELLQPSSESIATPRTADGSYFPQLDGIRAFAVFGVVAQHYLPFATSLMLGAVGVCTFFVISGFLITRILLRSADEIRAGRATHQHALRQFYARRFLRIFPLYYLYLAICVAAKLGDARSAVPWFATYLGNFYLSFHTGLTAPLGHFWTLAVEEQFYLLWPFCVLWIPRARLATVAVVLIVVGTVSKMLIYRSTGNDLAGYLLLPDCLDTLACGALLAMLADRIGLRRVYAYLRPAAIPGVAMVVAGALLIDSNFAKSLGFTVISAGICLAGSWLVVRACLNPGGRLAAVLLWRPVRYIGTISYGIYVWHVGVPILVGIACRRLHIAELNEWSFFLVVSVVSVAIASVSWRFFEKPINDLKRYFPYRTAMT